MSCWRGRARRADAPACPAAGIWRRPCLCLHGPGCLLPWAGSHGAHAAALLPPPQWRSTLTQVVPEPQLAVELQELLGAGRVGGRASGWVGWREGRGRAGARGGRPGARAAWWHGSRGAAAGGCTGGAASAATSAGSAAPFPRGQPGGTAGRTARRPCWRSRWAAPGCHRCGAGCQPRRTTGGPWPGGRGRRTTAGPSRGARARRC